MTHHHHDHSALVQDLRELTGAKLIVHKKQVKHLTAGTTDYKRVNQCNWLLWIIDKVMRPMIQYNYRPVRISPIDLVINSDFDDITLRALGVCGKIIATPGIAKILYN